MKKYIYYLFGALLAVAFYSCTSEENAMDGNTGRRITVSFGLPEGAASTRVDETTEDTGAESALHQADLYCFDYTGGEKGVLKSVIHLTENQLLQNNPAIDLENGDYYIEAIANENHLDLEEGTSTYADYLELRATSEDYTRWSEVGFIMQGANTAHITNATTVLNINFTMVRLVARIDVVNRVDGLTITGAKMENSVKESFYVEDETSIIAKESGSKETRTKSGLSVPNGRSVQIFYTYEGSVEESGLQISFEGVDEDGIKYASLPIVEFKNQNNHPAFMRNKLYTVTLYEVDGAIKTEVTVTDWASQAIENEVTVEDGLEVTVNPDGSGITLKDDNKAVAGDVKTIYVPAEGATFSVISESDNIAVEVVVLNGTDWLTVTETRSLVQKFQVVVAKNTAETERTGQFVVRNMLKPEVKVTYNVVQAGAEPAEPEGPDWDELPSINKPGAATLEQWASSKDAVGENGKEFFLYGIADPAVDEDTEVSVFDTHRPGTWSGVDPSESGYRMATKTDWEALVAVGASSNAYRYLTYNNKHYYISGRTASSSKFVLKFYECDEKGEYISSEQTITLQGGYIEATYDGGYPYGCTRLSKSTTYTYYWCGGNLAKYFVAFSSAGISVQQDTTSNNTSSKGRAWDALRIRSIKE
ncbi:BACON domain-containing carbohydrate-binding protein [Bacteroides sp. ET489]|uniref:BACON domain-containing protein n=1 Tax=Bacteroides sp. ET489 TaxID=3057126 RepID=UPI002674033B|nr:BACON domain-containing carbohydrate-binding protein [Bacteroides sp. ET489]MDO3389434.1 BACON domain-containing carbohydrate-binding protein [Bacteroides sp. ET489]